jgi:hypothetical protein
MMDFKVDMMKKLLAFNSDRIDEDDNLVTLKCRRMLQAERMFGKLGEAVTIELNFFTVWGCNVFIGDRVYINRG